MEPSLCIREIEEHRITSSHLRQRERWLISLLRFYQGRRRLSRLLLDWMCYSLAGIIVFKVFEVHHTSTVAVLFAGIMTVANYCITILLGTIIRLWHKFTRKQRREVERQLTCLCPHCERIQLLRGEKCGYCSAPLLPALSAYR